MLPMSVPWPHPGRSNQVSRHLLQRPRSVGDDLRWRLLNQWAPDALDSYVGIFDILNQLLPVAPGDLKRSSMTRSGSPLLVSVDESAPQVLRFTVDAMSNAPGQLSGFIDWVAGILPESVGRFLKVLNDVPGEPIPCMYVGMRPTDAGVGVKLYLGRLPHSPDVINGILTRLVSGFGQLRDCGAKLAELVNDWQSISPGMYGLGVTVTDDGPVALDGYFLMPMGTDNFDGFRDVSNGCDLKLLELDVRSAGVEFKGSSFGTAISVDLKGHVHSFKLEFPVLGEFRLLPSMSMSSRLGSLLWSGRPPAPDVLSFRANGRKAFSPVAYYHIAGLTKSSTEKPPPA